MKTDLDRKKRAFPGLALRDTEVPPSVPDDVFLRELGDLVSGNEPRPRSNVNDVTVHPPLEGVALAHHEEEKIDTATDMEAIDIRLMKSPSSSKFTMERYQV